jgi:diguanylate cyclase (GGDEF)-like protein/PAS domain S-box-containing protein
MSLMDNDAESQLLTLINASPDFIAFKDGNGCWKIANSAGLAMYGLSDKPYQGKTDAQLAEMLSSGLAEGLRICTTTDEQAWRERKMLRSVETVPTPDGGKLFFDVVKIPLFEPDKTRKALIVIGRNVTELVQAKEEARLATRVFENSQEAILVTDAENRIIKINQMFTGLTGYTIEDVQGQNPRMLSSGRHNKGFYQQMWRTLRAEGHWHGEVWDRRKNGEVYPKWLSISTVLNDDGEVMHYVGTYTDITEYKAAIAKIDFMAHHDPLTRLPNRVLLRDRFEQAAAIAVRTQSQVAMLFLDLDQFKQINDTLGHIQGDRLLLQVAERLKACVRESDTVSRIGGDEFVILLSEVQGMGAVQQVAEKVLERLSEPVWLEEYQVHTTCSIGCSVLPEDGSDFDTLFKKADTAMYYAKDSGRNAYRFFTDYMNIDAMERLEMQAHLRRALKHEEFQLYYQPQFDIASGKLIGAEALIRWMNPDVGMIPPNKFIPVAETTGLIIPIGEWVVQEACRQNRAWIDAGYEPIVIAINLSALQFKRGDIVETVFAAIHQYNINPEYLELELTESILLNDTENILKTIRYLKDLGFKLSIDDFGTGYSSLAYLKRFAVDKLKIDQSFVRNLGIDENDDAIVYSVINLGHSLKRRVIAEGVETQEQLEFLRQEGCDEVQGFLLGRPVPADQFEVYLVERELAARIQV